VPSVVSVMVVHQPGEWFEETLEAVAAQDYPNFRLLFLLTAHDETEIAEISERIRAVAPQAFIRSLAANAGFGPSANEVLRLVEGDNGFFLICHDDIAPAPSAVRLMVAELFRSNAGIVGPKLVEWSEPRRLQHVGLGLDRFGEVDPVVDPGEFDQEQHDAVRDVFVIPSACMLVRADLFRVLGGFDAGITFHGEDIEFCWRAHLTGARVIVAPDAVVRHRERLDERRPTLNHRALRSRHRMRTVATLTGGARLLGRSVQLVLLTLVELVVGLFTGRLGESLSSFRALGGLIPRTGSLIARRRAIRGQRVVQEREILGLQNRGSARLTSYLRGRETATFVGADSTVRRWREASFGPLLAWFLVLLMIAIGSRTLVRDGVPPVGEFLPFTDGPGDLWDQYRSSFDGRGFGSTAPLPTAWMLVPIVSVLTLFEMGLFLTVTIVGLYVAGAIGAWRLSTVFPVNRARIAGMVVYVGTPLVPGLLSRGDWSALLWYAALPWLVHLLRRSAGLETADPDAADLDLTDGVAPVGVRHRLRALAFLTLVLAASAAFVPVIVALWAVVGATLAIATLLAFGSWRVAAWLAGCTAVSVGLALLLNLPWAFEWTWADLAGARFEGSTGRSLPEIASLAPTTERFAVLAVALYLPLLAALLITRAWRLTWSVRAGALVAVFGALMVLGERGSIETALPSTAMLAVPVALGLALGAASIAGGFGSDVLGREIGWRQPIAVVANVAIVAGLIPASVAIADGAWNAPTTPMSVLLDSQFQSSSDSADADPDEPVPDDQDGGARFAGDGDYRVLYVGDPRVLPVPAREYRPGIAYAVTDAGQLGFADRFAIPETRGDEAVVRALDLVAAGSTLRAGRILAPLGIRFIVIPKTDGVVSTVDDPLLLPDGLLAAFENQLDIGSIYGPPSLELYVNQSWFPVGAQLRGATADASRLAGEENLARADLSETEPSMVGADEGEPTGSNEVAPGVLHLAIPFDDRIELGVGDEVIAPRTGFGVTTAFDVDRQGTGVLRYEQDTSRGLWRATQAVLWLAVLGMAIGARASFSRRRTSTLHDETLIDLSDVPMSSEGVLGEVLGVTAVHDELVDTGAHDAWETAESVPPEPARVAEDDGPVVSPVEPTEPSADAPAHPRRADDTPPTGTPIVPVERPASRRVVPRDDTGPDDDVDLAALVRSVDENDDEDGAS
jgi:GT2 family glycosyltransferase